MTTPLFRGSDLWVVTTTYTGNPDGDSMDSIGGYPLSALQVFATYDDAREFALKEVAERTVVDEDDGEDEERVTQRGGDDGWEIRNYYEIVYVEIHRETIR